MTRMKKATKSEPPSAEEGWAERLPHTTIDFKKVWNLRCFYCTPRDQLTWLKVHHRNLWLSRDEKCLACGQHNERIAHLCRCPTLRDDFWFPIVSLMVDLGMPICEEQFLDAFLALGYIDEDTAMCEEQAGIMFIAWRCLYAEIVGARMDERRPRWNDTARRAVAMLISRLTAEGEHWVQWYRSIENTSRMQLFPEEKRDRKLIRTERDASYELSTVLINYYNSLKKKVGPNANPQQPSACMR